MAGADEAGRGCLAGPLVAAAVLFDYERLSLSDVRSLSALNDSKQHTAEMRELLYPRVLRAAVRVSITSRCVRGIDERGLHKTNLAALSDTLRRVAVDGCVCLSDGFPVPATGFDQHPVVGGDARSAAIAGASVIAKVTRDRFMQRMEDRYPGWEFATHVGYSTPEHRDADLPPRRLAAAPALVPVDGVPAARPLSESLESIVRATPWLARALHAARAVDAPDWLLTAGAIRTAVWDDLHGFSPPAGASASPARPPASLADIDLAFFDPADRTPARDAAVEAALRAAAPDLPWDAKNQAAVHLWYPDRFGFAVEPFACSADAVATYPETATCVALHLDAGDRLTVVAPYGLDDLLGLVHRHNPRRVPAELYERRLAEKRIAERWPRVTVIPAARPGSRAPRPRRGTSPPR